jgi:adenylylsulfate kinase
LYKKARAGEITFFTGFGSPDEAPERPELVGNTHKLTLDESI